MATGAVRSLCDFKHSQTELYLDTRARASFWGGGGGRALQRGPQGTPRAVGQSLCERPESLHSHRLPYPGKAGTASLRPWRLSGWLHVQLEKNKSRSGWTILRRARLRAGVWGLLWSVPVLSACPLSLPPQWAPSQASWVWPVGSPGGAVLVLATS